MTNEAPSVTPLTEVEVLHVRDGDVILFKSKTRIPSDGVERIKSQLMTLLADMGVSGVKFAMLEDGADISVVRPECAS